MNSIQVLDMLAALRLACAQMPEIDIAKLKRAYEQQIEEIRLKIKYLGEIERDAVGIKLPPGKRTPAPSGKAPLQRAVMTALTKLGKKATPTEVTAAVIEGGYPRQSHRLLISSVAPVLRRMEKAGQLTRTEIDGQAFFEISV